MTNELKLPSLMTDTQRRKVARWRHNFFLGFCAMGRSHMQAIIDSKTASPAAKQRALEISIALSGLTLLLVERIDG